MFFINSLLSLVLLKRRIMISNKDYYFVILLSFVLTAVIFFRTDFLIQSHPDFAKPWDHHKYIYMAEHPFQFHVPPFCWRILYPLCAYLLPFSLQTSFLVLSFISVWFSGILLFFLLTKLDLTPPTSIIGMLMFYSSSWATKWLLFDFWIPDGMYLLLLILLLFLYFL